MKYIKFLLTGVFFGIVLVKSEIASWYRTVEMFSFQSFHLFGVLFSAVLIGIIFLQLSKIFQKKSIEGTPICVPNKENGTVRYIIGGTIFGLGWALTAACPGPMFVLIGTGAYSIIIVLISALLGTFLYGVLKDKLPH